MCVCGAYRVSVAKAEVEVHCATSHGRLGKQEVKEVVEDAVNQRISFAFSLALFLSSLTLAFSFRVAQVLSRLLSHFSLHSENFSTDFVCLFLFLALPHVN